jgi:hypothetical protein
MAIEAADAGLTGFRTIQVCPKDPAAVYFGPIPILSSAPDDPKDRWASFPEGIPPGRVEAYDIRVHRGDVLAVLRSRGLLPTASAAGVLPGVDSRQGRH